MFGFLPGGEMGGDPACDHTEASAVNGILIFLYGPIPPGVFRDDIIEKCRIFRCSLAPEGVFYAGEMLFHIVVGQFMGGSLGEGIPCKVGKNIDETLFFCGKRLTADDFACAGGSYDLYFCPFPADIKSPLFCAAFFVQRGYFPGICQRKGDPARGLDPQKTPHIPAGPAEKFSRLPVIGHCRMAADTAESSSIG